MDMGSVEWRKVLTLVVGCVAKFTTGSLFSFNVYQDAIKDTFNYTQKEVELLSSMLNLGLGMGFVPGVFYDRFGPRGTSTISLVISVSSYLLIWSTHRSVEFYSYNAWLMAIYFFMCGLGSVFTYMAALNTNLINFDKRHSGKVVGVLNACFSGSASVFAVIYYNFFVSRDSGDFKNQNLPGFMLLFAVLFGIVDILCILFLRIEINSTEQFTELDEEMDAQAWSLKHVEGSKPAALYESFNTTGPHDNVTGEDAQRVSNSNVAKAFYEPYTDTVIESESGDNGRVSTESHRVKATSNTDTPLTLKELMKQMDYQLLIWMFGFASCIALVFGNNITVISRSLHLEQYDSLLTVTMPITNGALSLVIGFFSDYFIEQISRLSIVIIACCISLFALILVISFANVLWVLAFATGMTGLAMSALWSISPTIMREKFYVGNIGRNWGVAILLAVMLGFVSQEVFGAIYDNEITEAGETHCYGMKCVRGGTGVLICLNIISILIGIGLYIKSFR